MFEKRCAVVTQEDYHWAHLTTKETLTYAARLLIHMKPDDIEFQVNEMMSHTGLETCADTKVGNAFIKGLSGGQKRRLSVAMVMLKDLDVLYLDEPTSGLDSASAKEIMHFIKELSELHNLISLTTIHQPSTAVYNGFDRVMILSRGRMAYCGKAGETALNYFDTIGYPMPPNTNPAEFMVDMVNSDFRDEEVVKSILDTWYNNKDHKVGGDQIPALKDHLPACDFMGQVRILLERHGILALRDPMLYLGRSFVFVIATLFFAVIYVKSRSLQQDQVLTRMWYLGWCIGMPANMGVIAVFAYNMEFFAVRREVRNGMISPKAYILASSILQLPVMALFGVFGISVGGYGVLKMVASHYLPIWLVYSLCMYAFEVFAQLCSVLVTSPLLGMLTFVLVWFTSFLFCGLMIPVADVIWPFKIFAYIMPLKYGLRSIIYHEFIDQDWKGARVCNPNADSNCFQIGNNDGNKDGFTCGVFEAGSLCFGAKGWQVLEIMRNSFTFIENKDTLMMDCVWIIVIVFVAKVIHAYVTVRRCNTYMKLHSYKNDEKST